MSNYHDAVCTNCGEPFRWLTGTPQPCPKCLRPEPEQIVLDGFRIRVADPAKFIPALERFCRRWAEGGEWWFEWKRH